MMSRTRNSMLAVVAGVVLASSMGIANAQENSAQPGPAQQARQKLFERIQQAKSQGIGIGGYLQAFNSLEEQAKGGESEEKLNARIQQIHKSINDQMDRAKVLKTQRPLPPQGSQIRGSEPAPVAAGGGGGGAGIPAGGAAGLAEKLKSKFGGQIGDKLDNLPEGIRDRLGDPETRAKLMERFGGKIPGGGDIPTPPAAGGGGAGGGHSGGGGAPAGGGAAGGSGQTAGGND